MNTSPENRVIVDLENRVVDDCENGVFEDDESESSIIEKKRKETMSIFGQATKKFYEKVGRDIKGISNTLDKKKKKKIMSILKEKYSHLKDASTSEKMLKKRARIQELLQYFGDGRGGLFPVFSVEDKHIIYLCCIKKIRGLYKHAQTMKTGICNFQIIENLNEKSTITVCITKNILEANKQWLVRLFDTVRERYPTYDLSDIIMLISSSTKAFGPLNGLATHCKTLDAARGKFVNEAHKFKIVFVCSNSTRIHDILKMADYFQALKSDLRRDLRIIHDEAHNDMEGIPAHRSTIENIIAHETVLSYQPVTATIGPIGDESNPMWRRKNLEDEAINYTSCDNTKSIDPKYSSCRDSKTITIEDIKMKDGWKNYNVTEVSRNLYSRVHEDIAKKEKDCIVQAEILEARAESSPEEERTAAEAAAEEARSEADDVTAIIERKRKLAYSSFILNEMEAVNNGLNCLRLNELTGEDLIQKDSFGLYIMSTPCRRVVTEYLAKAAMKMDYKPNVLSIYGSKGGNHHLYMDGRRVLGVRRFFSGGGSQFNEGLSKLIEYIKTQGYYDRPLIVMANYSHTGESLTYVNYKYGTVRLNIKLVSSTAEKDYQEACRSNYMHDKFLEHEPSWVQPEKYLIGTREFIQNVTAYEDENDARIDFLQNNSTDENRTILPSATERQEDSDGTVATPVKITFHDPSHTKVKELIEISCKSGNKSKEDRRMLLVLLKECIDDEYADCHFDDPSGKFDFETYNLKIARCYRQKKEDDGTLIQPPRDQWKFASYQSHFDLSTPFMNSRNSHEPGDCELLACRDMYILKDESGKEIDRNSKTVWWMGYKF